MANDWVHWVGHSLVCQILLQIVMRAVITTKQIFNLRILCEKYLQHQQDLYNVFIDFRKVVWHAALWATVKKYNISTSLILVIKNLYDKATSAVLFNSSIGNWFQTTV